MENIFTSILAKGIRVGNQAQNIVKEEETRKNELKVKLESASGLDGVLAVLSQEKKEAKERKEKDDLRDKILSL